MAPSKDSQEFVSLVSTAVIHLRGPPRVDDRGVLNGIFWRLGVGASRADILRDLRPAHHLLQQVSWFGAKAASGTP